MFQLGAQLLQHDISITRCAQRIGCPFDSAINLLEGFRLAAEFIGIERGAHAARGDTHFMHRFNILVFQHFIRPFEKLFETFA